jgi:hypothetical protein
MKAVHIKKNAILIKELRPIVEYHCDAKLIKKVNLSLRQILQFFRQPIILCIY